MSFAFLPLYTGDYRRDTAHLSCSEHGIYLMLLMHCWDSKGPVPLDERKILGICNARSGDEIEALRRVLQEFFTAMDDGWYNKRMQREVERAAAISIKRKSAGAKGFQAIAKHLPGKSLASASTLTPTPTPTTTPIKDKEPTALVGQKPDHLLARQILDFLNHQTGKHYQPVKANLGLIVARLKEGYSADDVRSVVAMKVEQWKADEKMAEYLRPATLFNRTNFAQYQGQLVGGEND